MSIVSRYTSFKGRLGRMRYWIMGFRASVVASLFLIVVLFAASVSKTLGIILAVFLIGLICFIQLSILVRRLHDLNLSGWWMLLLTPLYIFVYATLDTGSDDALTNFALIGGLIFFAISIILGFKKGSKGENIYGPSPV